MCYSVWAREGAGSRGKPREGEGTTRGVSVQLGGTHAAGDQQHQKQQQQEQATTGTHDDGGAYTSNVGVTSCRITPARAVLVP